MTKARCSQQSITIISLIWANMITHNGKQVTLAMRNRKAINLIARNGKAMFGELEDLNRAGIDAAAKAVILAEYGKQVWSDVRDYAKAHPAIVPFINQDPHLACSISPNSNKERIVTVRNKSLNAYNNGLILPITWQEVGSMDMRIRTSNNNAMIISQANSATSYGGYYSFGGTNGSGVTITRNGIFTLNELVNVGLTFATNTKTQSLRLCGWQNANWTYDIEIVHWNIYDTAGELRCQLVPFVTAEGEVCFLNLVDCTLQHNVYTDPFTIAITDKE